MIINTGENTVMKRKKSFGSYCLLAAMVIGLSSARAATKAEPKIPLTEAGQKLLARYSGMRTALQAEIAKALPTVDGQKKAAQELEYTFEAPQAGKYALVARVVTVQSDQKLLLKPNDAKEPVEIAVPYTIGRWEQTPPVEIALAKGQNVLRFTRPAPSRGLTIKDFTLTPVK